jgi:hypothetical protein
MFIRKKFADDKKMGIVVAISLLLVAAFALAIQIWPQRKPNLAQAYYTDDDGQTWFKDSAFKVAPFDHNGKTAVIAEIYSYDNGNKQFCAYLAKYTSDLKQRLESALADAQTKGLPPNSVSLFNDRQGLNSGTLVKSPGDSNSWMPFNDPRATPIFSIHSPDGSVVDEVFVY